MNNKKTYKILDEKGGLISRVDGTNITTSGPYIIVYDGNDLVAIMPSENVAAVLLAAT